MEKKRHGRFVYCLSRSNLRLCSAHQVADRERQQKGEDEKGQGTETKAAGARCLDNDALGSWMGIGQDVSIVVGPGGFYSRTCIEGNKEEEIN